MSAEQKGMTGLYCDPAYISIRAEGVPGMLFPDEWEAPEHKEIALQEPTHHMVSERSGFNLTTPTLVRRPHYLAWLCAAALAVRLGSYWLRPGIAAPDEVFQYFEQAHRLIFGDAIIPWEYIVGIRNWLVPVVMAIIMLVSRMGGDDPTIQVGAVVIGSALLSLCPVVCAFRWGCNLKGLAAGLTAAGLNAFWLEAVYMGVHPLPDSIAASIFISALYLACPATDGPGKRELFWAGVLFGLTLVVRIQLGPAVILAACWCGRGKIRERYVPMALGGLIPILALGYCDALTWGYPFRSIWLYVKLNADVSSHFGVLPVYWLLFREAGIWSLFTPLIILCGVMGTRRLPVAGAVTAVILMTFSSVPHKELRFIYPAVPLIMTLVGIGSSELLGNLLSRLNLRVSQRSAGMAGIMFWAAVSAGLGIFGPFHALWSGGTGAIAAAKLVTADPQACGLAVIPIGALHRTGGQTFLRSGIPIVALATPQAADSSVGYNYILTFDHQNIGEESADQIACWHEQRWNGTPTTICLWHTRANCVHGTSTQVQAMVPPFFDQIKQWAPR